MKKIQLVAPTLVAVLALGAFVSTSASAAFETAQWLASAKVIPAGGLVSEASGGATFENVTVGASFLCEGLFVGKLEPNGVGTLTEVLTTGGVKVEALDESGATGGIKCTSLKLCEGTPEAWPVNLPFKGVLGLEGAGFLGLAVNGEFFLLCQVLGIDATELCVVAPNSLSGGALVNLATDVEGQGSGEPLGTCNGNVETGLVTADAGNLAFLANGEALAASE
jgi:hypothetical protein